MNEAPFDLESGEVELHPVIIIYASDKITTFLMLDGDNGEPESKFYSVPTSEILGTSDVKRQGQVGKLTLTLTAAYTAKVFDD
jgi:hypothetical protein